MPVNMNLAALYMNENGEYKPIPRVQTDPGRARGAGRDAYHLGGRHPWRPSRHNRRSRGVYEH